jgi:peptide/nickel transport system substrate-binding protein
MLTEYKKNETKTAEKFADYWRGWSKPHITKIVWPIVPEAATRRQMLEKGQAHIVRSLPLVDAKALESNPAAQVLYTRAFISWTMPMTMFKGPLDNLKVRQAMQYAFDYQTYLDQVWLGHGTIASGATPPGLAGYTADSPPFKYDLEKAKQLIAESGLSNLTLEQFYIDTSAEEKQSAVLLQSALKQIGVDLKLTAMPWATMFKKIGTKEESPNMTNLQIGPTRPDPAFTMEWAYGGKYVGKPYNWSYFSDPRVDDLIAKARASADREQGKKYLEEANRLIIAAAPTVWYSQPDRYDTISAKVQNFAPINIGYPGEMDYFELYLSD